MSSQRLTDLMQSTAAENDIKFFFVTKSGSIDEASEDLKYSFQVRTNRLLFYSLLATIYNLYRPQYYGVDNSGLRSDNREFTMVVGSRLSSFRSPHTDQRECVRFGRVCGWSVRSFVNRQGYVSWLRFWIESGLSYMTLEWTGTKLRHFFRFILFICRVIGPRVLISCQSSNDVVPNISSPIFTLAMKDVIVCVSGIDFEKRSEIHKLVGFMGGLSSKDLIDTTTHLITNTIKSPKYEVYVIASQSIRRWSNCAHRSFSLIQCHILSFSFDLF